MICYTLPKTDNYCALIHFNSSRFNWKCSCGFKSHF